MNRYRSTRRSALPIRPLVAFLLIASFGILFAGCTPDTEQPSDEFTFTAEDVSKLMEFTDQQEDSLDQELGDIRLDLPDTEEESEDIVLDVSMADTYAAIRSGPSESGDDVYRVTNEFLNVRADPRVTSESVGRLVRGDIVRVQEFKDAAWAKVLLSDGKTEGYVAQRYIAKLVSEDRLEADKESFKGKYFVDFSFLNVRKDPDAESPKIGELPGQAFVTPLSMDRVWARIPFEGKEAYVATQYLSPFLPNFLVRQDTFALPIILYPVDQEGVTEALTRHIDRFAQEGIRILTMRDFYDLLLTQENRDVRLSPHSVVIGITGLTNENVGGVSDALIASRATVTFFVQTDRIGLRGITEKNILTLLANGHDIQSAGHTGDDLRSLTNAQLKLELRQSRQILEAVTKRAVSAVAYPRGGVNSRVAEQAAEIGYLLGIASAPDRAFSRDQLLRLPSFMVKGSTTGDELMKLVKGEGEL